MSILDIRIHPDPVLREKCLEVEEFDDQLGKLLDNMAETMYEAPGIGLAAPQIGITQRIAVVDVSENGNGLLELINPVIEEKRGEQIPSEEGCLSIPEYRDTIQRYPEISVKAQDRTGKTFEIEATEILAICIQHELDHLDGVLFIDHLSRLKRDTFKRWYKKYLAHLS